MDDIEPENFVALDKEKYKFSQFKNILIKFLNENPLISYKHFSYAALKFFRKIKFYIDLKDITLKNYIIIGREIIVYSNRI